MRPKRAETSEPAWVKPEDIIHEKEHILTFLIAVIFGRGQSRQGDPGPGPGRFGHLPINQGRFGENPGIFHFQIKVVSFAGTLPHTGKNRDPAVMHGDVVDHLHHNHGLAHAGAAEHPHLTPAGEGNQTGR